MLYKFCITYRKISCCSIHGELQSGGEVQIPHTTQAVSSGSNKITTCGISGASSSAANQRRHVYGLPHPPTPSTSSNSANHVFAIPNSTAPLRNYTSGLDNRNNGLHNYHQHLDHTSNHQQNPVQHSVANTVSHFQGTYGNYQQAAVLTHSALNQRPVPLRHNSSAER